QHLGQRAAARVDRAAGQVVVELAGDEHLLRGRLDLGDEFGRAIFPGELLAENGVAKGGAQQAGQVGLGQVALRGPDLPGAADRVAEQQGRRRGGAGGGGGGVGG